MYVVTKIKSTNSCGTVTIGAKMFLLLMCAVAAAAAAATCFISSMYVPTGCATIEFPMCHVGECKSESDVILPGRNL